MMRPDQRSLGANSDFVKFWAGQTVSKFGSHITDAAMAATAVLVLQASPAQMGLLGALGGLPILLVSLFAGVWVDRLRRKPILVVADLGRAIILITIPFAVWADALTMAQLYLVAALVGILTVLYHVADQSFLPAIVERQHLVEANARISASESLAEIAGPSLAGTLVQWLGAPLAILADITTYLFSVASLVLIRIPEPRPAPQASPNVWREIQEGLLSALQQPILRALMGVTAMHRFFGSFIGTIYWLFLVRDLGFTPAMVGISIGAGGIGALIGAMAAGLFTRRLGVGHTLIACIIIAPLWSGLLLLPIYIWPINMVFGLMLVMQVAGDIFWSVFFINVASLRQTVIPPALLGRVSASFDFIGEGAAPLGALLAGGIATAIGMRATWLLGAAGILAGSLWLIMSPIRRLHTLPEHIADGHFGD